MSVVVLLLTSAIHNIAVVCKIVTSNEIYNLRHNIQKTVTGTRFWNRFWNFRTGSLEPGTLESGMLLTLLTSKKVEYLLSFSCLPVTS